MSLRSKPLCVMC